MRIRTVKPEMWSSPSFGRLSDGAKLLFIFLMNVVDDSGVGEFVPRRLLGEWRPFDDSMSVDEFHLLVGEIHRHVDVTFYRVGERCYFRFDKWHIHQKIDPRFKGSRFPTFEEGTPIDPETMQVIDGVDVSHPLVGVPHLQVGGEHLHVSLGTGEQGNRGTGEYIRSKPKPEVEVEGFDEFWETYPRKVGKRHAHKAFAAATKRATPRTIIQAAHQLANDPNLPEPRFIPHPSTWLNQDRWNDDPLPPRQTTTPTTPPRTDLDDFLETWEDTPYIDIPPLPEIEGDNS